MSSCDEILSVLNDTRQLATLLKERSHLTLPDSIFSHIANHFLTQPVSIEGLAAQRNLYGRLRTSSLDQAELDLLVMNIKSCLHSDSEQLTKTFLQYLHNINRLLPDESRDMAYLCAVILLPNAHTNTIACILCAYLQMNTFHNTRFDLIINGLYDREEEEEEEGRPWVDQLTEILVDKDNQWLRQDYLEKIYAHQLLQSIDTHNKETMFQIDSSTQSSEQLASTTIEKLDLSQVQSFSDLRSTMISHVRDSLSTERITDRALTRLLSSPTNYPHDLHVLFACSLISLINPTNYSKSLLRLFRQLVHLINNYYIHQHDLLDDNQYRLIVVYLVSKLLCEVHRRRSKGEHQWYQLYVDVPKEHPLPTFELFSDVLCLLATLSYNHRDCQNQVRKVPGTIESILSMTRIDLNQPKAQPSVAWLLKCLTENNEENRDYIRQIK